MLLYVACIWSVPAVMFFFAVRARARDLSPASTVPPDFRMIRFFPIVVPNDLYRESRILYSYSELIHDTAYLIMSFPIYDGHLS